MKKLFVGVAIFVGSLLGLVAVQGPVTRQPPVVAQQPPAQVQPKPVQPPAVPPQPQKNAITVRIPSYLPYPKLVEQLKTWSREAPAMTEVGTYGKSSKGTDLYYINVRTKAGTPKVLITGSIHGNEPLSTTTLMGYVGTMLGTYGEDAEVTELLNTRDIYFAPVISPDTFTTSRHVDGVDPNRDFAGPRNWSHKSVPPVKAISDFMVKHRFKAAISGHTHGRIYLTPHGDTKELCPNHADFARIVGKMGQLSGYRVDRACNMYPTVIHGTDVDFYYRHGAFAIVMEFGTHQRIPSDQDTKVEFDKTYRAVLHFIKEAPLVEIKAVR